MTERWLAIVNPRAGGFRRRQFGAEFIDALRARVAQIAILDDRTTATSIAAQAREFTGIIAVGGDGTLSAVLGAMDRTRQRFAAIPAGTGNCLARDLGVQDIRSALRAIDAGRPLGLDLMETRVLMGEREHTCWLASTAGIGYPAQVALLAKRRFAWLGGHAYSAAAMLVRPWREEMELSCNGMPAECHSLAGLLVNNTRHIGRARAFPAAAVDDGKLEMMKFCSGQALQGAHNLVLMSGMGGRGSARPRAVTSVRLRCARPLAAMLDGEVLEGVTEMHITCRPRAVICMAAR